MERLPKFLDDLESAVFAVRLLQHGFAWQLILTLLFIATIVATLMLSPLVLGTAIVGVLTFLAAEGLDRLCFRPACRKISC